MKNVLFVPKCSQMMIKDSKWFKKNLFFRIGNKGSKVVPFGLKLSQILSNGSLKDMRHCWNMDRYFSNWGSFFNYIKKHELVDTTLVMSLYMYI